MPNRIIKESICRSDEIDALSWFEEVLFYRLIVNCDDYGRFDARPKIVKSACFPLKDVRESNIESALNKLTAVGLVRVYQAQGKPVLQLTTWDKHQQIRAKKSKYPAFDGTCEQLKSSEIICNQLQENVPVIQSNPNPIQSEYESNPNLCTEPDESASVPQNVVITLTLNDKTEYPIFQEQVDEWSKLYPAVDVIQQLRAMKGWLDSNPSKRKTKNGIKRFINGWLSREQDKGGVKNPQNAPKSNRSNPFLAMLREEESHDPF